MRDESGVSNLNVNLRKARLDAGFTGRELASKVGLAEASYLMGESLMCTFSEGVENQIADVLQEDRRYLFPEWARYIAEEERNYRKRRDFRKKRDLDLGNLCYDENGFGEKVEVYLNERDDSERVYDDVAEEESVEDFAERVSREDVRNAMAKLPSNERKLLELRYGFRGEPKLLREIGEEHYEGIFSRPVRKQTVLNLEKKALRHLRFIFVREGFLERPAED